MENFAELIIYEKEKSNIIQQLKNEKKPLILWGAGDIGFGVKKYLLENNISINAVWVDGIIETSEFDGIEILSLDSIKSKYEKFNVILGHSHFDFGNKIKEEEPQINKVYYLVSASYNQYDNISYSFVQNHYKDYYSIYNILSDNKSRECMIAYLNARINNNIEYIQNCIEYEQNFFNNDIFKVSNNENYVDVGAFDGDTLKLFLEECNCTYRKIFAFEPEDENFKKLQAYVSDNELKNVELFKTGTWSEKTTLYFDDEAEQRFSISDSENGNLLVVDSLDNILKEESVSLIKINFYHGVLETLQGATRILQRCKPKMAIAVGVDEWGIIKIPSYVKQIVPEYNIYMRFNSCIPARLTMYAEIGEK